MPSPFLYIWNRIYAVKVAHTIQYEHLDKFIINVSTLTPVFHLFNRAIDKNRGTSAEENRVGHKNIHKKWIKL